MATLAAPEVNATTQRTPAVFIGHGSPMNTLEDNGYTQAWQRIGKTVGTPRGILAVSAHWYINATAVTAMPNPRTIHDFRGFPQNLFDFQYPAAGLPELAEAVADIAKPDSVTLDHSEWGLDHGTWSVLAHMFPEANVPVVQLSIHAGKPIDYHLALGAKLAALQEQGILVLSSGNVVHNLGRVNWHAGDHGEAWAQRFDEATIDIMTTRPGDLAELERHPDYAAAVPTAEHFLPLAYTAGIAAATTGTAQTLIHGYALGALSMTSYGVSCQNLRCQEGHDAAALPRHVPPEQTNA